MANTLFDKSLARIKALPSYDQRQQMRESLAPGGESFTGPPAPDGPLTGRMAPVSTPRLDAGVTKVSMSAPTAMHGSEKEAGREYQRATALLHRLSRKGTLAQRADAAMAAVDFRDKAKQRGFNPVGVQSHAEAEGGITGRMQDRRQSGIDMSLFQRAERLRAQRYLDNPAGNQKVPNGTNSTATETMPPTNGYDFTSDQPPSFENLTNPSGGFTPIDKAQTPPSPLETMAENFRKTGTGLSNSLSKILRGKSVGDSRIPRFRDGI